MKTEITRAQLAEAAQAVKGLVSKDGLSAFSKIRLDASGCLSVTGSNGDVQVEWRLEDGEIENTGTVTLPGAAFVSFVAAMPEGKVEIDDDFGKKVRMRGGGVVFKLAAGEAIDFPMMAGPKDEAKAALHIGAALFREMLRKVRFAVSTDATRANLAGVNIDLKDGRLGMTATDGRRLAHVESIDVTDKAMLGMNVTLPTKTVAILYGLLERMSDGDVYMVFDGSAVRIVGDKWGMTAKVLAAAYPDWHRVVPEDKGGTTHLIRMKRTMFLEAMGRAALASDETGGVKITIMNGRATFEARNDITAAKTDMPVEDMDNVKCEFRVNPRLMKDALEVIDDDEFILHTDCGDSTPLKLTCTVPWVAVIMPYRKEG